MTKNRPNRGRLTLGAVASATAIALAFSACGGDDVSQEDVDKAADEAVQEAQEKERVEELEKKLKKAKRDRAEQPTGGSSSSSSVSGEDCGNGVSAGANTSCPFALYVAEGYRAEGPGVIRAYSPTTGETYAMTCEAGAPAVCQGGNNASVYVYD